MAAIPCVRLVALVGALVAMLAACRPVLPPEMVSSFAPERLPLGQRIAGAFEEDAAVNPLVLLYPELRTASAPRWLRPGTRVTYRVGYATLSQPRYPRMPDDPPPPMPAGGGLLQYDVVAEDRGNVVVQTTTFNPDIAGAPPSLLSYAVALPGTGEIWFSPQVLANVVSIPEANFTATRMPMEVEGVTYDVVRMNSVTPPTAESAAGETVWAFEASTGLLVFYRQELRYPDGTPQSGFVMSLLDQRTIRLPWRRGSVPEWVAPGTEIRLTGMQYYHTGIGPAVPLSMEIGTRIRRVGRLWSEQSHTVISGGWLLDESTSVTGVAQLFFGYWLPRAALETLETGQVLDQDPLTGVTIRVAQADRNRVVLEAAGVGHVTRMGYDATTGALIALYQEQHGATGTLVIDLAAQ